MGEAKSFMYGEWRECWQHIAYGNSSMFLFHWHDERNNCRKESWCTERKKQDAWCDAKELYEYKTGPLRATDRSLKFHSPLEWRILHSIASCHLMVLLYRLFFFFSFYFFSFFSFFPPWGAWQGKKEQKTLLLGKLRHEKITTTCLQDRRHSPALY